VSTIDVDLPKDIFDVQVNVPLIHQVVVAQQAAARQGTHSTKNRGEVSGGGAKPYRQKGTGRARQGSSRAPQFAGGGIVHGPTPRSYAQRTPKKMKAAALRGALSDRARAGRIHVVDSFVTGGAPSTKTALSTLRGLTGRPRILIVIERGDDLPVRTSSLSGRFADRMKKSDIKLTFHGLRHGHASLMLAAGEHLKVVSEQLGHSTIGIAGDLYTHVAPAVRREAANKLDTLLASFIQPG